MTMTRSGCATATVALMLVACARQDLTELSPIVVNGGAGGSSPEAGGPDDAGARGGASGSGGSIDADLPDAGRARFRAVLQGETVVLTALDPVWMHTCSNNPRLVQRVGDAWTLLRDERPDAFNMHHAAHYLDGSYHSDCSLSLGCDYTSCSQFSESGEDFEGFRSRAREYVQVGQRSALSCDAADAGSELDAASEGDAGTRLVPTVESRAPSGPLGVRIQYFVDPCQTEPITVDVAVE